MAADRLGGTYHPICSSCAEVASQQQADRIAHCKRTPAAAAGRLGSPPVPTHHSGQCEASAYQHTITRALFTAVPQLREPSVAFWRHTCTYVVTLSDDGEARRRRRGAYRQVSITARRRARRAGVGSEDGSGRPGSAPRASDPPVQQPASYLCYRLQPLAASELVARRCTDVGPECNCR